MSRLLLSGTAFGGLDNVVDITVNDVIGQSVLTFTIVDRVKTWQIDNGWHHIVERTARSGHVLSHYELDADNDVLMMDAEDGDNRFVPRA